MAQTLQHRRSSTAALAGQVGTVGEIYMDETKKTLVVMDGVTPGGSPMAKESSLPSKLSDLTNDAGFVTENYIVNSLVFSGDYADLTNTPALFSGAYADLTGKPNLGVYQLASTAFSGSYADLTNTPALFSGAYADLTGKPALFSGAYADLTGKPDLAVYQLASSAFSGAYADLTGAPNLSTYQLTVDAFSGNYNDLGNKPTLFTGAYSPATPADWDGTPPTTLAAAVDRLAAVVKALNGGVGA